MPTALLLMLGVATTLSTIMAFALYILPELIRAN